MVYAAMDKGGGLMVYAAMEKGAGAYSVGCDG